MMIIGFLSNILRGYNRRNLLLAPKFIDNEMIYYNVLLEEFYVFDNEGKWVNLLIFILIYVLYILYIIYVI